MSKVVMSLPKGMVKDVTVGTVVSLGTYVGLQFLWALLIDRGMLGMERLYPLVCIAAALASFLGCGCTLLRGREGAMFMTLTLTAALLTAETISIENGVTGLGLSMAAGGLLAALIGGNLPRGNRRSRRHSRTRRSVKGAK